MKILISSANDNQVAHDRLNGVQKLPDVGELLAVAESDPAILASLISFYGLSVSPATGWEQSFTMPVLRSVGIALATDRVARYVSPRELETVSANRKESHLHGMLAQEIALTMQSVDPVQAKVAAVLTGLPCLLAEIQTSDPGIDTTAGNRLNDIYAADLLADWGLSPWLSDVVRYQSRELSELDDASEIIRVVAVARALIPYVSGPELVDNQLLLALNRLIKIDEETLYGIVGRAGLNYDRQERLLEKNALKDSSRFEMVEATSANSPPMRLMRLLSDHALGMVFDDLLLAPEHSPNPLAGSPRYSNEGAPILGKGVLEVARFLFGFTSVCHFSPLIDSDSEGKPARLIGRVTGESGVVGRAEIEEIEINTQSSRSYIATAFRDELAIKVPETEIVAVSELQLSKRLGGAGLICIPLTKDTGVLVCSRSNFSSNAQDAEQGTEEVTSSIKMPLAEMFPDGLLERFIETLIKRFRNDLAFKKNAGLLEVDYVKRRVSEVTHEVNNPLAVVQNYLRTLSLKLDENAPVQSDINTISEEILRVSKIVRKYSDIGRKEDLLTESVNINQVLMKLLEVFKGGHDKLEIRTNFDIGMPPILMSSDSFKQVFVNLIKNSIEALNGQQHQLVTIDTHSDVNFGGKSYVEIIVADNGPGIPVEIKSRLFQPDNSGKSEGHSGLGLSIVKSLMEDMSGMVSCRSQTKQEGVSGTVFQLLIPK